MAGKWADEWAEEWADELAEMTAKLKVVKMAALTVDQMVGK